MPAYVLVLAALWFRRWVLLVVAVAIVACHLTWVLPDYASAKAIPADAWVAPRLRVFSTNVRWDNPDIDAIMAEAVAADPDVILIQEFTPQVKQAAEDGGLAAKYPYFVGTANEGARGTAIYSRVPLLDPEVWDVGGIPMTRASVEVGGRRVRLYNVHPVSPTNRQSEGLWNQELELLRDTLAMEHENLVVAGDFNMTQHHRWYEKFTDIGLRDAHVERGKGNATTWPNGQRWYPPIRIDQVFLRGEAVCLSIREGTGRGSDHRPMLFEVALMG